MNDSTHKIFLNRLGLSHIAVFFLSRHIQRKGHWVKLPPTAESPTYQERAKYSDDGDLFFNGLRLEVKRIKKVFTGRADWPYEDFIICSVSSFERAKEQGNPPSFILSLVLITSTWHRSQWRVKSIGLCVRRGTEVQVSITMPILLRLGLLNGNQLKYEIRERLSN